MPERATTYYYVTRALSVIAAQQAEVLKSERTVTSGEGSRRHADREHTGSSRRQLEADRDHTQERCSRLPRSQTQLCRDHDASRKPESLDTCSRVNRRGQLRTELEVTPRFLQPEIIFFQGHSNFLCAPGRPGPQPAGPGPKVLVYLLVPA